MQYLLKNINRYKNKVFTQTDIYIKDSRISFSAPKDFDDVIIIDANKYYLFPGLTDVHVHFRQPGFSYKETIKTGSIAAMSAGFTSVCTMPNLNPVTDNKENLFAQLDIINRDSPINILPFASITKDQKGQELSEMEYLSKYVAGFSDDGFGVANDDLMFNAMIKAKKLNKIITSHCEDNSLSKNGIINDCLFAKQNSFPTISSESEYIQVKRDIELSKKTACSLHICHVSTKESVELIRQAKKENVDISCETAPHYLLLNDSMITDDGKYKMKPPIRSEADRIALIDGILDSTIDMIATDHAPHAFNEKNGGILHSLFGVSGIEISFPLMYTHFVKTGIIDLDKLIELMCINPQKRFFKDLNPLDICVYDLSNEYTIDPTKFLSMGKSTPFDGYQVFSTCLLTAVNGQIIYNKIF